MSVGSFFDALLKYAPEFFDSLLKYAPLLTALGILIGAVAGWVTYFSYYRKTLNDNWNTVFRLLYAEYWNSDEMAQMRKCLASEEQYVEIELILRKRLLTPLNTLSESENDVLERIDRFCALMIRIISFGERKMNKQQKDLYTPLFTYWLDAVAKREALLGYIKVHWTALYKRLNIKK